MAEPEKNPASPEEDDEPRAATPRRVDATIDVLDGDREALAAFRDAILGE